MASDGNPNPVPQPADQLPRHTTPTWEVELLISGVAVFAMLQLPGWLDDRWFALAQRLDPTWTRPAEFAYLYGKTAALLLAATFVLHLLLRAHWIAAVGMHSVYPGGIDWSRLRMGPVQREVEQARHGDTDAAIERADNRATVVFAIGVMLASVLLVMAVLVPACFYVLLAGARMHSSNALLAAVALVVLPLVVANAIDRRFGARWSAHSRPWRVLRGVFGFYSRIGFGRSSNPSMALLSSHGGEQRTMLLSAAVMGLAVVAALLGYKAQRDPASLGQYALFPRPSPGLARTVDPAYYDDQRNPGRDDAVPYVQAMVVTGPYLRLVVPFVPRRDVPALQRGCAAARAPGGGDAQALATLACLSRLHALRLDGAPLADARFDAGSDPRTDRPALVAMVDVRKLAPGRHELQVARQAAPGELQAPASDRIPFWR